jgi:hypothetical protein
MNQQDLDLAYSTICRTMTDVGRENAELFLARFAILSIVRIGDLEKLHQIIAEAAEGLDALSATADAQSKTVSNQGYTA